MSDLMSQHIAAPIGKPVPRPSPESEPFWTAAAAHRLELPKCDACERFWFPPSRSCPHCLSSAFRWQQVSGRGRIFSFVIYDRVYHPAFADEVPYAVALVELDEGPRMVSNILGIPADAVRCDMKVEVVFKTVSETIAIPCFKPA